MRWEKLGRIFSGGGRSDWSASHAYMPTPYLLDKRRIRVYAAFLDADRVGRVGFVDVAAENPIQVLDVSPRPALDIGENGTFDDNGVTPMSAVEEGGSLRLYYIGWQLGARVPYFLFTGLATSTDGGAKFRRYSKTPILDRVDGEHVCRSAPCVLREGERWRMWYVAGSRWITVAGKLVPTYEIRHTESADGLVWTSPGTVVLGLANDDEFGLGRPYVVRGADDYLMWYSIRRRSRSYRIGLARSRDGIAWTRQDERVGIDISPAGWDSEMICFAAVVETNYGVYMFYNGNNYGETGFGVAVLHEGL